MARSWGFDDDDGDGSDPAEATDAMRVTMADEAGMILARIRATPSHAAPSGIDHPTRSHIDDLTALVGRLATQVETLQSEERAHRKKIAFLCSVIKINITRHRIRYVAAEAAVVEKEILEEWGK